MSDGPPKTLSSRFQALSCLQPVEPSRYAQCDQKRLPAPAAPAAAENRFSAPQTAEQQSRIVLLAPLPDERKPAIGSQACNALNQRRAVFYSNISSGPAHDIVGADQREYFSMQIALFQPDIPQNTGTILRLCACLDVAAHIIEPAGFPTSDRHFRRAGMDYLDQVAMTRHDSWSKFEQWRREAGYRLVLFTTKGVDFLSGLSLRRLPTSCYSGGSPQGSPTRWSRPPTRGW